MESTNSVDRREVARYNKLAEDWWNPTGPLWPLHQLNELRVSWILDQLQRLELVPGDTGRLLSGLKVLDVGCGGGILSASLARMGATVHGIDVAERNIEIAKAHAEKEKLNIYYDHMTVEELATSGAQYDVVFNMEVVEHVADLTSFMQGCCRLVRPGGATFVATINRNPIAWLTAVFGAEYVLKWLPKGTHRYSMLRKPSEIRAELKAAGLSTRAWSGVSVNPFNRRFSLSRLRTVNYMVCALKDSAC